MVDEELTDEEKKGRNYMRRILLHGVNSFYGICEVLRCIYDLIEDHPDTQRKNELTEKLIDALIMAKKMNDRLVYYKTTYNDTTGHSGSNIKKAPGAKHKSIMRHKRPL